jgi:hypothetical protein
MQDKTTDALEIASRAQRTRSVIVSDFDGRLRGDDKLPQFYEIVTFSEGFDNCEHILFLIGGNDRGWKEGTDSGVRCRKRHFA